MKILIELQCDINQSEALDMVTEFEKEPWVKKATILEGCGNCNEGSCESCGILKHIVSHG